MRCPHCGNETNEGELFCVTCGARLDNNEPVNNVYNNQVPKKSNKTVLIIAIVSIVALIGIVLAIILLTNKGDSNNNSEDGSGSSSSDSENTSVDNGNNENGGKTNTSNNKKETAEEKTKRLISNISKEFSCDLNQEQCLLVVKNNNNENVNVVLSDITFYDSNNQIDGIVQGPLYANGLGPGETGYIRVREPSTMSGSTSFDHYDINLMLQNFTFNNHKKDLTYTVTEDTVNEEFVFHVKNNSDSIIDSVKIGMLFYKNDKLVAVINYSDSRDEEGNYLTYIKPYEEFKITVEYPYVKGYSGEVVDYDRYETIILEAYEHTDASSIRYRNSHKRD